MAQTTRTPGGAPQEYAGQRLGLPQDGAGSIAGWGRRVLALFVDWIPCLLVANLISASAGLGGTASDFLPLLVFLVEVTLFTSVAGGSFGQLATRLVVVRLDRRPVSFLDALVRTVLVCLVVPPLVFDRDGRGLHDFAVATMTLRR